MAFSLAADGGVNIRGGTNAQDYIKQATNVDDLNSLMAALQLNSDSTAKVPETQKEILMEAIQARKSVLAHMGLDRSSTFGGKNSPAWSESWTEGAGHTPKDAKNMKSSGDKKV